MQRVVKKLKEAYYFSHDSNARHDPKILSLRSVYGSEGYGWYWIIIEMLREQDGFKIELTKYVWNALAMQTQCNADAMQQFVEDCINEFKLFVSDGQFFWSDSLQRRMEIRNDKSEKARKAAEARWGKSNNTKVSANSEEKQSGSNALAMQTHSGSNAIKEKKVKEIKVKEKKNIYAEFVSMSEEQYSKLIQEFGEDGANERIERLNLYKGSTGKKYKDDYLTILNWERKNKKDGADIGNQVKRDFKQTQRTSGKQYDIEPPTIDFHQR